MYLYKCNMYIIRICLYFFISATRSITSYQQLTLLIECVYPLFMNTVLDQETNSQCNNLWSLGQFAFGNEPVFKPSCITG